ncbi:CBS domain-containing protein [Streptomyces mexicanus]|uniref:CBS domain-containing protein n=1 Tax=Streptomyces mexicanus TaxID=178566 RepID=UPI0031EE98EA
MLRYLGAVATVSAKHATAESQETCATGGRAPTPSPTAPSVQQAGGPLAQRPPRHPEPEAPLVRDVMDVPAASVGEDVPCRDIARVLAREHVGAVPVVDADDRVVGVVSESDLLAKVAFAASCRRPGPVGMLRGRRLHEKARAETAADLMTSPAITVLPGATVAEAAWLASLSRLKRIPVTDHGGRLVGVVRRDALLAALIRDDERIRKEIETKIQSFCSPADRDAVTVTVHDGVVELTGRMPRAATARLVAEAEDMDDVVEVNNHLTVV